MDVRVRDVDAPRPRQRLPYVRGGRILRFAREGHGRLRVMSGGYLRRHGKS
jgi:hypothetical protein